MQKLNNETIARIVMLRACNYSHKEIADRLNLSKTTVGEYLRNINSDAEQEGVEIVFSQIMSHLLTVDFK